MTSQDPPWEQGWLWQGSVSTSHHWPVIRVKLDITHSFSLCLSPDSFLGVSLALGMQAKGFKGISSGVGHRQED